VEEEGDMGKVRPESSLAEGVRFRPNIVPARPCLR